MLEELLSANCSYLCHSCLDWKQKNNLFLFSKESEVLRHRDFNTPELSDAFLPLPLPTSLTLSLQHVLSHLVDKLLMSLKFSLLSLLLPFFIFFCFFKENILYRFICLLLFSVLCHYPSGDTQCFIRLTWWQIQPRMYSRWKSWVQHHYWCSTIQGPLCHI